MFDAGYVISRYGSVKKFEACDRPPNTEELSIDMGEASLTILKVMSRRCGHTLQNLDGW